MKFKGTVVVTLKDGIFDPQGAAVKRSLQTMGYSQVSNVRLGKHVLVFLNAESKEEAFDLLEEMARRLLSNPVIETYTVAVEKVSGQQEELPK